MAKILMVVGSQHTNGFQSQLADAIVKAIGERAEVETLDYANVPFVNQDTEFPAPEAVTAARNAFKEADGVWIVSPVFNDTYSAQVKNLLDWVSRPLEANVRETAVSNGIKVTYSSAAGGDASAHMFEDLNDLLNFIGMSVMSEPVLGYSLTSEWATGTLALDEDAQSKLNAQVDAFLKFIA